MDCEGCEYDTILPSTADTLKFFSHIQVEYHQGLPESKRKTREEWFFRVGYSTVERTMEFS
jgi:hypothetical protein